MGCRSCSLSTPYHDESKSHNVKEVREMSTYYAITHCLTDFRFSLQCQYCGHTVCSVCLFVGNESLNTATCPSCRISLILQHGYNKETRLFFEKYNRKCLWTLLLIRNRWKQERHVMAQLPVLFWLQKFSKYLL
jgi:hypothetical protein